MERKEPIRQRILGLRDKMPREERDRKSAEIVKKTLQTQWYCEAGILLAYANFRSEVDTKELIRMGLLDGKKVYCPRVEGKRMNFYRILSMDDLEDGYRGIKEPPAKAESLFSGSRAAPAACLMIMPGSVFDKERNRMGYGKGYYDQYLAFLWKESPAFRLRTIGLCFECQMQERIPVEAHDRKADMVITEKRIYE